MSPSSNPPRRTLFVRLSTLAFFDEFVPFAVLFTLWFSDEGLTIGQISAAFVVWAVAALVFEIPTGALADRVDRRKLLACAFALRATGLAVWLIWPTLTGLLVGSALWAIHDAAAGGAWEALIHDQLVAIDAADTYTVIMARVGQWSHLGLAAAALLASPMLGLGLSLEAVGWASCALMMVTIVLVLQLRDVRWVVEASRHEASDDDTPGAAGDTAGEMVAAWRAIRTAMSDRAVTILLTVGALLAGLSILDEYIALLGRERGASDTVVPLLFISTWAGLIIGGEVAARRPDMSASRLSLFLTAGGVAALLALVLDPLWALAGFGVTYAAIDTVWVLADARLQSRTPSHVRATVSSARELGGGVIVAIALGLVGLIANGDDPTPGLLIVAIALVATGLLSSRLPD